MIDCGCCLRSKPLLYELYELNELYELYEHRGKRLRVSRFSTASEKRDDYLAARQLLRGLGGKASPALRVFSCSTNTPTVDPRLDSNCPRGVFAMSLDDTIIVVVLTFEHSC